MGVRARPGRKEFFVPSHEPGGRSPGFGTFGEFMVSDQIRQPVEMAATAVMMIAKAMSPRSTDARDGHYVDHFDVESTPDMVVVVGKEFPNPRVLVRVSNSAKNAVAVEFGSGERSVGDSAGEERPQGGWNIQMRPLGRAGEKIGRSG